MDNAIWNLLAQDHFQTKCQDSTQTGKRMFDIFLLFQAILTLTKPTRQVNHSSLTYLLFVILKNKKIKKKNETKQTRAKIKEITQDWTGFNIFIRLHQFKPILVGLGFKYKKLLLHYGDWFRILQEIFYYLDTMKIIRCNHLLTGGTLPLPGAAPRPAAWACREGWGIVRVNICISQTVLLHKYEKYKESWKQCHFTIEYREKRIYSGSHGNSTPSSYSESWTLALQKAIIPCVNKDLSSETIKITGEPKSSTLILASKRLNIGAFLSISGITMNLEKFWH